MGYKSKHGKIKRYSITHKKYHTCPLSGQTIPVYNQISRCVLLLFSISTINCPTPQSLDQFESAPGTGDIVKMRATIIISFVLLPLALGRNMGDLCSGQPYNTLLPDPMDCKSFYLCRDGLTIHETCSESFWFDPKRLVCTLPDHYCKELACVGYKNTFAEDPEECGVYHWCTADEAVQFSGKCQDNLSFIASSQSCTYPYCSSVNTVMDKPDVQVEAILL